jgi:hypothetical protein
LHHTARNGREGQVFIKDEAAFWTPATRWLAGASTRTEKPPAGQKVVFRPENVADTHHGSFTAHRSGFWQDIALEEMLTWPSENVPRREPLIFINGPKGVKSNSPK